MRRELEPVQTDSFRTLKGHFKSTKEARITQDELERAKLHPDVLRNLAKNKQLKKTEAYSEDNPPPYPVTSVNGQTGAVSLNAEGVGALPDTYVPPVTSVDGQTGDVTTMRVTDSGTTQDSSGATWSYRKWSNGDIDLWLTGTSSSSFTFSAAQTGPTNGMYRRIESRSFTILTDILWMTATGTNSCYFIAGIQKTGNNSFDVIQQGINGTTTNLWVSIHIKGRWQ